MFLRYTNVPAAEIERAVVDQIRCIGNDPDLLRETLKEARRQVEVKIERLAGERRGIERRLTRSHTEIRRLAASAAPSSAVTGRIADLNDQVRDGERRLTEINAETAEFQHDLVSEADVATAFADFDTVWRALSPREQARLIGLLVARVEFDVADSAIELTFHPTGIKTLADEAREAAEHVEDAA